MCYTASQTVVCVQKRLGGGGCAEVALEEAEQEAGDSGVESGSGSVQHTGIPMENPPPGEKTKLRIPKLYKWLLLCMVYGSNT